jgi:Na+/glutamate symporter
LALTLHLSAVWTVVAALLTIELGRRINRALPWLERGSIPPSVTAGLFYRWCSRDCAAAV